MKLQLSLFITLIALTANSQNLNIVPQPVEVKRGTGTFTITSTTSLVVINAVDDNTANFFNDYLKRFYGIKLKKVKAPPADNYIQFTTLETLVPGKEGAYNLVAGKTNVYIAGETASGTFYGMQTLIQLLPALKQPAQKLIVAGITITDYPRFGYRGMHLDCGRHFFSIDFIKKYIDYLALHKFNKFHWHLTEDQGWRIEIKKYPKLTAVGGWRNGTIIGRYPGTGNDGIRYGGLYTQEQIKEIVKYAADRYITVIPEIEMPGHSSAAIAAYPELSCFPDEPTIKYFSKQCKWNGDTTGKQVQQTWGVFNDVFCAGQENTFQFIENVLDEVLALFPSKYIHIGGDECPKENWHRCLHCQKRIKDNKLKDEHELQSYFIQRVEKYLNSKGRILIGWDEILEGGLAPNAVVMSWRGEKGGIEAAQQNHDVVMTPGNPVYFDHTQSENEDSVTIGGFNPIEKVYAYEPVPAALTAEQAKHVLGAQANVWTEYMKNTKKVEYMIFPRMAALSEVLWSKKEDKNWDDFEKRLLMQFKRYDLWKANYSKAYFDLKATVMPTDNFNGLHWKLKSKLPNPITINFNGGDSIWQYKQPQLITKSTRTAYAYYSPSGKQVGVQQKFCFNKATGKKITLEKEASNSYPGDGAFTLVNGVQNEKGLARSKEFLGFSGDDCIATIDLGKEENISFVKVHCYHQAGSWIYRPASVSVTVSADGINFLPVAISNPIITDSESINEFSKPVQARFVKINIANYGSIPSGNPGAGHKAWLFVDEIEIN